MGPVFCLSSRANALAKLINDELERFVGGHAIVNTKAPPLWHVCRGTRDPLEAVPLQFDLLSNCMDTING